MKRKNITTSIGTINLNNIEICDESLDIFIGIESVSADIQDKINEAVEIAKAEHIQMMKSFVHRRDLIWSSAGVDTDLSLHIIVDNKKFTYRIEIDITDKADSTMWADASIEVDLSEHQNELKKVIVKAMIDKFF